MIAHFAGYVVDILIQNSKIPVDDKELYQYGLEVGIAQIIGIASVFVLGLLFKMPIESICLLLCFMTLRTYAGGYHSSSHLICYILSMIMNAAILLAGKFISIYSLDYIGIILAIIGIFLLIWLAPVEDRNKPMDEVEKTVFRKRAMRYLLIWLLVTAALLFTPFRDIHIILCLCLFSMGLFAVCGVWKNHKLHRQS